MLPLRMLSLITIYCVLKSFFFFLKREKTYKH
jgi:hypothetical protein